MKMKLLRTIVTLMVCLSLLFSVTSCVVITGKNNGMHKGWYKNSNNPHHPISTNPGKTKK